MARIQHNQHNPLFSSFRPNALLKILLCGALLVNSSALSAHTPVADVSTQSAHQGLSQQQLIQIDNQRKSQLERFIRVFEADNRYQQQQISSELMLAGVSDVSLFDIIDHKLYLSLPDATTKTGINYSASLLKVLAYSGNPKYAQRFSKIVNGDYHKKLRKYAKKYQVLLDKYQVWNGILNNTHYYLPNESLHDNQLIAAIQSDELELKRTTARHIFKLKLNALPILNSLERELKHPRLLEHNRLAIDTYAWMAKALAQSRLPQYRPLLSEISATSPEKKLRGYAEDYLEDYY
ncbi:hypothetical protein [Shewanella surugensis]|uniref:Uncharacterized protein n=1 Tax=Shewanella surugensis TaxID=212020 RepID=A0ABT0LA98_9GAMM|nr:hypothetical protein [Shewanella surugensis]MCL1124588.1 hypothetical protein [Shewanella surugensis]